jgi:hypothetical protein
MDLFSEKHCVEMILIGEGSHSLLTMKWEGTIFETDRIRPSITIIRGPNSSAIFQMGWKSWDCDFVIENENCKVIQPLR